MFFMTLLDLATAALGPGLTFMGFGPGLAFDFPFGSALDLAFGPAFGLAFGAALAFAEAFASSFAGASDACSSTNSLISMI